MAESEEELKILLMKVEEESKKADLKLSIEKTKIMASVPFAPWQIVAGEMGRYSDTLYFLGLQNHWTVTAATKLRHLLLGRKVMTNLGSMLKSRDITLPEKVRIVKAMVFQ